jgi:hypothetical protein
MLAIVAIDSAQSCALCLPQPFIAGVTDELQPWQ